MRKAYGRQRTVTAICADDQESSTRLGVEKNYTWFTTLGWRLLLKLS